MDQFRLKLFLRDHLPESSFAHGKQILYWLRAIPCLGRGVECPCCGHHLRRFVTFRGSSALCPWCGSLPRHRLLCRFLEQRTNLFQDRLTVLYFAPDALERRLRSASNLTYITADLYQKAMIKVDITAIPFSNNSFDVVLCSHVLEHIPDDAKAMAELNRILKPGGWAILLVPCEMNRATTFEDPSITDPIERLRLFKQEDHVRIYGRDYISRLEAAGFVVEWDIKYTKQMDSTQRVRYGLPEHYDLFYCTRPVPLS